MSDIYVHGLGAVSPAGWGVPALQAALAANEPLPVTALVRPGWPEGLQARIVPAPPVRPDFFLHPRLRRASPIARFTVGAALEALGTNVADGTVAPARLGIINCVMSGCVQYTRRFYEEALQSPATASPLLFPETVFNAPASHLAAVLGATGLSYSLVGDAGTFLQGLALAAEWLADGQVDGCLVLGTEEADWITADAFRHFSGRSVMSEGAGALFLRRTPHSSGVTLEKITAPALYLQGQSARAAAHRMRAELPGPSPERVLYLGTQNIPRLDRPEAAAWQDWTGPCVEPKRLLGEALTATAAWQCVAAAAGCTAARPEALVSVVGSNQQAIGAHFVRTTAPSLS